MIASAIVLLGLGFFLFYQSYIVYDKKEKMKGKGLFTTDISHMWIVEQILSTGATILITQGIAIIAYLLFK